MVINDVHHPRRHPEESTTQESPQSTAQRILGWWTNTPAEGKRQDPLPPTSLRSASQPRRSRVSTARRVGCNSHGGKPETPPYLVGVQAYCFNDQQEGGDDGSKKGAIESSCAPPWEPKPRVTCDRATIRLSGNSMILSLCGAGPRSVQDTSSTRGSKINFTHDHQFCQRLNLPEAKPNDN